MNIANCPQCDEQILLPGNLGNAIVRCSLCNSEFDSTDVSSRAITIVSLVKTGDAIDTGDASESFGPPNEFSFASDESESAIDEEVDRLFKLGDQPVVDGQMTPIVTSDRASTQPFVTTHAESSSGKNRVVGRANLRRKTDSPLLEIVKVALGGVAGLVIAQLILWWLPGGLRRDPIRLAPKLPNAISFLAPQSLRSSLDGELSTGLTGSNGEPRSDGRDLDFSKIGVNGNAQNSDTDAGTSSDGQNVLPIDSRSPITESLPVAALIDAPRLSVEELDVAYQNAAQSARDVVRSRNLETRRAFYTRLSELGRVATYVDRDVPRSAESLNDVESLLNSVIANPTQFAIVGVGASSWIQYQKRRTIGIAAAGTVRQIEKQGLLYEVTLELVKKPGSYIHGVTTIHPNKEVRLPYGIGSEILILGTIADQPATQISGYQGNQPTVVWIGMHSVKMP